MAEKIVFGTADFAANPVPRASCVLLLDTSAAMRGNSIDELNSVMVHCRGHLLAKVMAAKRADIAIITFGPVRVLQEFATVENFNPPAFKAEGRAPMGQAICRAIEMCAARRQMYRSGGQQYFRPGIFMITVGAPDDDLQEAAHRVRTGEAAKDFLFVTVGVSGSHTDTLKQITGRPPVMIPEMQFTDFFV
jgi:uncharacterized protein YegL